MLPKNKLRNARLKRLQIFDDHNAGPAIRNVTRRYDSIGVTTGSNPTTTTRSERRKRVSTTARRQDDTPPLGSLGGQLPKHLYTPKARAPKVKKRKLAPSQ